MLPEALVPPLYPYATLFRSGLLLLKAIVSAVEGLEGLPKLSWLWMVIGPPVGRESARQFNGELVKTGVLVCVAVTVSTWAGVDHQWPRPFAVMVGVPALVAP